MLLGVAGGVGILGPLLIVLVVGWAVSPTLALAAGLAVSLLLTMALLAGGWWWLTNGSGRPTGKPSHRTMGPLYPHGPPSPAARRDYRLRRHHLRRGEGGDEERDGRTDTGSRRGGGTKR